MELFGIILTILSLLLVVAIAAFFVAALVFLFKWGIVLILAGTTSSVVRSVTGKNTKSTKRRTK